MTERKGKQQMAPPFQPTQRRMPVDVQTAQDASGAKRVEVRERDGADRRISIVGGYIGKGHDDQQSDDLQPESLRTEQQYPRPDQIELLLYPQGPQMCKTACIPTPDLVDQEIRGVGKKIRGEFILPQLERQISFRQEEEGDHQVINGKQSQNAPRHKILYDPEPVYGGIIIQGVEQDGGDEKTRNGKENGHPVPHIGDFHRRKMRQ